MRAQAKAGFVEAAFATLEEMQRPPHLHRPDHFVCNTLVNACSRSEPPRPSEAMRVVEEIMPRSRLVPDRCPLTVGEWVNYLEVVRCTLILGITYCQQLIPSSCHNLKM